MMASRLGGAATPRRVHTGSEACGVGTCAHLTVMHVKDTGTYRPRARHRIRAGAGQGGVGKGKEVCFLEVGLRVKDEWLGLEKS